MVVVVLPIVVFLLLHRNDVLVVTAVVGVVLLSVGVSFLVGVSSRWAWPYRGRQEWHQEASQPMESVRFRHHLVRAR